MQNLKKDYPLWHPFTQHKTLSLLPEIVRAQGSELYTVEGHSIIDAISSWWTTLHGHAHPDLVSALSQQAQTLEHVMFAGFTHQPAIQLAEKLRTSSVFRGGFNEGRIFFSDNGSTAVEVALKLALQYWRNREGNTTTRRKIIAFEGGYHGDTFGAMSVGQASGFFRHFQEWCFEVEFLPFPETWEGDVDVCNKEAESLSQLEALLENAQDYATCIYEPLFQGAGGMRYARPEFFEALLHRLRQAGILSIQDEVAMGFGRTGGIFTTESIKEVPDFMTLSKGITGGFLPLAATLIQPDIYEAFLGEGFNTALAHGHSYTANPLACAVALASWELLNSSLCQSQRENIEKTYYHIWLPTLERNPYLNFFRIQGTIFACDFQWDLESVSAYQSSLSRRAAEWFLKEGVNLRPLDSTLYVMPPYGTSSKQMAYILEKIVYFVSYILPSWGVKVKESSEQRKQGVNFFF